MLPRSALKVCVVLGGFESEFSDLIWLELSLGRAGKKSTIFRVNLMGKLLLIY
jgi:hypothetical protein